MIEEGLKLVFKIGTLIAEAVEAKDEARRAQLVAEAQAANEELTRVLGGLEAKLDARNAEMLRRAAEKAGVQTSDR